MVGWVDLENVEVEWVDGEALEGQLQPADHVVRDWKAVLALGLAGQVERAIVRVPDDVPELFAVHRKAP